MWLRLGVIKSLKSKGEEIKMFSGGCIPYQHPKNILISSALFSIRRNPFEPTRAFGGCRKAYVLIVLWRTYAYGGYVRTGGTYARGGFEPICPGPVWGVIKSLKSVTPVHRSAGVAWTDWSHPPARMGPIRPSPPRGTGHRCNRFQ